MPFECAEKDECAGKAECAGKDEIAGKADYAGKTSAQERARRRIIGKCAARKPSLRRSSRRLKERPT
eukprot:4411550-Heterocapsa_arctica.AAC.1